MKLIEIVFEPELAVTLKEAGITNRVITLDFMLDYGRIDLAVDSEYRKQLWLETHDHQVKAPFDWEKMVKTYQGLMKDVYRAQAVRIWLDQGASSQCGFYFLCRLLLDFKGPVALIRMPDYLLHAGGSFISYKSWKEVLDDEISDFLRLEEKLSEADLRYFSFKWHDLQCENSELRVVVEGKVLSVSENFYDVFLLNEMPDIDFLVGSLIGQVISKYQLSVSDGWYMRRLKYMIEKGELLVVKEAKRFSEYWLRKV